MSAEKRLWLAVVLSMMVVFFWELAFAPKQKKQPAIVSQTVADTSAMEIAQPRMTAADTGLQSDTLSNLDKASARSFTLALPQYRATFQETGGVIGELELTAYDCVETNHRRSPVKMVSSYANQSGHFALAMEESDRSGLTHDKWQAETSASSVTFTLSPRLAEIPAGVEIAKRITFGDDYASTLDLIVRNRSDRVISFATGKLTHDLQEMTSAGSLLLHLGPGLGDNHPERLYQEQYFVNGAYGVGGKLEKAVLAKSWWHSVFGLPDPPRQIEWVALENRYFVIALVPQDFKIDADFSYTDSKLLQTWLLLPSFQLDSGKEKIFSFKVLTGPKKTGILTSISPGLKALDGMEPRVLPRNISFARWMVDLLALIERFVKNWGVSIILLTVAVRALLFPLSYYQFKSMAKMGTLKPKIEEVQKKYATDKERLQRELMKIYQEAGVNPLGGCLPIFLQMPILVGLYIALQYSIELRGEPFVWWIKDLSIPDTILYIIGLPINPLPIAMGATMVIQQKLTPMPAADPAQKQMFVFMTIFMTFLFYNFPSGLSLYWLTQNILSIGQQYYMTRGREVAGDAKR